MHQIAKSAASIRRETSFWLSTVGSGRRSLGGRQGITELVVLERLDEKGILGGTVLERRKDDAEEGARGRACECLRRDNRALYQDA